MSSGSKAKGVSGSGSKGKARTIVAEVQKSIRQNSKLARTPDYAVEKLALLGGLTPDAAEKWLQESKIPSAAVNILSAYGLLLRAVKLGTQYPNLVSVTDAEAADAASDANNPPLGVLNTTRTTLALLDDANDAEIGKVAKEKRAELVRGITLLAEKLVSLVEAAKTMMDGAAESDTAAKQAKDMLAAVRARMGSDGVKDLLDALETNA